MQNDKEIFDMIKGNYPQYPSENFITSTETKLRQKARRMNRNWKVKRISAISSGLLFFTLSLSWLFLFDGKETLTNVLTSNENEMLSSVVNEKDPLVFIYHTHNTETYNVKNSKKAEDTYSETKNVTLVGEELSKALKENNISNIHDNTDFLGILEEQNLSFSNAYNVSRLKLQEILNEYKSIKMVLDIHRDSQKRSYTTVNIDGKDYAKISFFVSKTTDNYEANKAFAERLHEKIEKLYPGLSKGVFEKGENPRNTYNQDLHENSLSLNIGGHENTFEEAYRTADALAEAIKEIINE
ncbi:MULTISPECIES: stage II sporulation protein P [Bacillales]|uniref:Stage II sporulation protein P n=1 Tax=Lysinibacillus halotolerans TaxID=1368476 RepID=A0A3M8HB21_9BACI|nr:stage II sporulation protein P [Lysinibacillus halotolerans]RNC99529.1 stage II sporulation protein P [Lysinibacillus halotolerans]